jgi:hypothetical protein
MSGDATYMDYSSILRPIDPQLLKQGSDRFVPAPGYFEQYDHLV